MDIINNVTLIGRCVADPKLTTLQNGNSKTEVTIACERSMSKDKKEEAKSKGWPTADFPRCIFWGKSAENVAKYFAKGSMIAVQGSIQTGSYTNAEGAKIYTTDVNANHFEFVGESKGGGNKTGGAMAGGGSDDGMGNYNPDDFENPEYEEDPPF